MNASPSTVGISKATALAWWVRRWRGAHAVQLMLFQSFGQVLKLHSRKTQFLSEESQR